MNIHKDMMSILRRKYFPPVESSTENSVTVDQHMKDLSLQGEIQELVRSCLRASGRSANKTKVKSYINNPTWKNKEETNKEVLENKTRQEGQEHVTADSQPGSDGTQITSLLLDRAAVETGDVTRTPGMQNYINGLITEDELNNEKY